MWTDLSSNNIRFENQKGVKVKKLRTDGGGEFLSNQFNEWLDSKGILRSITPANTPQRNGVAERLNRTLLDKARSMILSGNLDKSFWGEAISTANFLKNRSPTKSKLKTPEEIYSGFKPKASYLQIFGSKCEYTVSQKQLKLNDRTRSAIFVGYVPEDSLYRLWDIQHKRIVSARVTDVLF
jgi:transposase InsO family protein